MEAWKSPETIALWLVLGIGVVVLLTVFIVLLIHSHFKRVIATRMQESQMKLDHQKELLRSSAQVQEEERKRIATDLHDGLIGKLYVTRLMSGKNKAQADKQIDQCIELARRISHDLAPPLIDETTLLELIQDTLDHWMTPLNVSLFTTIHIIREVEVNFKLQIVRILQEVMTNIAKHANSSSVIVIVRQSSDSFSMNIADDGVGFKTSTAASGLGMRSIESRVQLLNGNYKVKSNPEYGTRLIFNFNT